MNRDFEEPNLYNHLTSLLEGMSIIQSQMVALTASNKAMQLVLQCRLVEMENRLKDGRADDLQAILSRLSDLAMIAGAASGAATPDPKNSFRSTHNPAAAGSWSRGRTASSPSAISTTAA